MAAGGGAGAAVVPDWISAVERNEYIIPSNITLEYVVAEMVPFLGKVEQVVRPALLLSAALEWCKNCNRVGKCRSATYKEKYVIIARTLHRSLFSGATDEEQSMRLLGDYVAVSTTS